MGRSQPVNHWMSPSNLPDYNPPLNLSTRSTISEQKANGLNFARTSFFLWWFLSTGSRSEENGSQTLLEAAIVLSLSFTYLSVNKCVQPSKRTEHRPRLEGKLSGVETLPSSCAILCSSPSWLLLCFYRIWSTTATFPFLWSSQFHPPTRWKKKCPRNKCVDT